MPGGNRPGAVVSVCQETWEVQCEVTQERDSPTGRAWPQVRLTNNHQGHLLSEVRAASLDQVLICTICYHW